MEGTDADCVNGKSVEDPLFFSTFTELLFSRLPGLQYS